MENEFWEKSTVFEEEYFVSNTGKVKNKYGKILKPYLAKNGYYYISLCNKGERKTMTLHRLIALSFVPNFSNKPMVNHIDGCKTNNDLINLEWCTPKENSKHAWEIGLMENSRQKATIRMSKIGSQYKEQNGQRLKEFSKVTSKRIAIYSLEGEKISEYKSMKNLIQNTGINHKDIKRCIENNIPHLRRKIYFKYIPQPNEIVYER